MNEELKDTAQAMTMSNEGTAPRSEIQALPIIRLAKEGDPKALEYLRGWGDHTRDRGDAPEGMTYSELWAYVLQDLRDLRLEKRRKELTGAGE